MSSSDSSNYLDLERDLPTTVTDVAALRRFRRDLELTFADFLELLSDFDLFPASRNDRLASEDWEPFQL